MFTPPPSPNPINFQHRYTDLPPLPSSDLPSLFLSEDDSDLSPHWSPLPKFTITPPPSEKQPLVSDSDDDSDDSDMVNEKQRQQQPPHYYHHHQRLVPSETETIKKRIGRRTTFTIVAVPLVLILVTLSTKFLSPPFSFDPFFRSEDALLSSTSNGSSNPSVSVGTSAEPLTTVVWDWHLDKRQQSSTRASSSSSSQSTSVPPPGQSSPPSPSAPAPTVPSSPPVLPTPFPQPLDTSIPLQFADQGCKDFFVNMTQTRPFRGCRPFSLLQRSSSEFIKSQTNLTNLNTLIWGTCNTNLAEDECLANMNWFKSNLKKHCDKDLDEPNAIVVNTYKGLEAYTLLRHAACLINEQTNSYCYVEAAKSTNPSDLYFYQIPLGVPFPATAKPSCSSCGKQLLNLYAQPGNNANVSGLTETYVGAAKIADGVCGNGYATLSLNGGAVGGGWTRVSGVAKVGVAVGWAVLMTVVVGAL